MATPTNFTLDYALASHPGQLRPLNEDAIGARPDIGLFVLCDGLGGYNAGEIAATMAVSSLLSTLAADYEQASAAGAPFDPRQVMSERMIEMNGVISSAAANSAAFEGMATTIVVAWILGDRLWVAHAGDSRLYRFREGVLEALTRDHSFSQELLDAGMVTEEEAKLLPSKNLVTRALGAGGEVEPEVNDYPLRIGDVLMLCSDGLTEMVDDVQIAGAIFASVPDVQRAAQRLLDMANAAGGRDNVSVIVVRLAGRKGLEPRRASAAEVRSSVASKAASPSG
ncbi:MAG: serine/threonine-protein phosphatase [Burkholderiales bacterium]|jgi:protein phosphatase|nr:serine/threonine-protein phosphatase [Burkholderiales bacterium]